MRRSRARALAVSGLALSLTAAGNGVLAQGHEEVLRSWQDHVKIDGRDQPRFVEIVFDYELGVARRRVYDAQDVLISDEALAGQPRATTAEIAEAFDTVRRDPEIGQMARSVNAIFDGGFLLREAAGEPCGPPTRCVQVFVLSESGHEEHLHPIVDLNPRGRIVYRDYTPRTAD